jgi:hypothetical protein
MLWERYHEAFRQRSARFLPLWPELGKAQLA